MKERIAFAFLFKWKYLIAICKAKLLFEKPITEVKKITHVAREADKSWIFGAKVRRLSKYSTLDALPYFHNRLKDIPKSDGFFFIFPNYFCRAIRHNPFILNRKNIVMYTHPSWSFSYSKKHISWCLKRAHKVICLNSLAKKELIGIGVEESKIEIIHIASSPEMFYPHERKNKKNIGFCCAYSQRKNPDLIFDIIKNMPEKHFYIMGKLWENYSKYNELISFSNFTYINNADYSEYPKFYNEIDTFISASFLEGGPVPVLEAMLSNCVPVVSKTGFCEDIIKHGENGFLFDIDADYKEVIKLIKEADTLNTSIRETVLEHSWENSAKKIDQLFNS